LPNLQQVEATKLAIRHVSISLIGTECVIFSTPLMTGFNFLSRRARWLFYAETLPAKLQVTGVFIDVIAIIKTSSIR
jgi:hypothetical protein